MKVRHIQSENLHMNGKHSVIKSGVISLKLLLYMLISAAYTLRVAITWISMDPVQEGHTNLWSILYKEIMF